MDKMYCPLAKDKCVNEFCMWYVIGLDHCAVNILAQALDGLANDVEEIKNA